MAPIAAKLRGSKVPSGRSSHSRKAKRKGKRY